MTTQILDWSAELNRRVTTALADLDQVMPSFLAQETHAGDCWRVHTGCLAARIRTTLTGEDPDR